MKISKSTFPWASLLLFLLARPGLGKHGHRSPFSHRASHVHNSVERSLESSDTSGLLGQQNTSTQETSLRTRGLDGRFTFYQTGLGACGKYNKPSDFIVALNAAQWEGGKHCFEMITIEHGGKKTRAQIVDLCPSCPYGALDCSQGLFGYLAELSLGVIHGTWHFGIDDVGSLEKHIKPAPKNPQENATHKHKDKPQPQPKPKTKPHPKAKAPTTDVVDTDPVMTIQTIGNSYQDTGGLDLGITSTVPTITLVPPIPVIPTHTTITPDALVMFASDTAKAPAEPTPSVLDAFNLAVIGLATTITTSIQHTP